MFDDYVFKKHEKMFNEFLSLTLIVFLLNCFRVCFIIFTYFEFIFIVLTTLHGLRILYVAYKDKYWCKIEMCLAERENNCPSYKGLNCEECNTHNEYCFKCEYYRACEDCENNNMCTKCIKDVYMKKLIEDKMRGDR